MMLAAMPGTGGCNRRSARVAERERWKGGG
jgi:hypothetical protein